METELQRLIGLTHEAMGEKRRWGLAYGRHSIIDGKDESGHDRWRRIDGAKWRVFGENFDLAGPLTDTPEEALRGALRILANDSAASADTTDTTAREVRADADRLRKLADQA